MAQITMEAEKVKEMCDTAIEYYLNQSGSLKESNNRAIDKFEEGLPDTDLARKHFKEAKESMAVTSLMSGGYGYGGPFVKEICTLRRIKALAEMSDTIWVSDSDMELLSKKLGEGREPHTEKVQPHPMQPVEIASQEAVSSIEVVEACLKSDGRGGDDPSAFEVALVTEAEKNRDLLYTELMEHIDSYREGLCILGHDELIVMFDKINQQTPDKPAEKLYRLSRSKIKSVNHNATGKLKYLENFGEGLETVLQNWFEKDIKESDKGTLCVLFGVPADCFERIK